MLEKSNYYPGQKSKEEIVLFIRRHIIAYAKWIIILVIMFIVPTVFFIIMLLNGTIVITDTNKYFFVIGIGLYYLLVLAVFLTTWIDYYLDVTIITKEHLINIKQNELFNRSVAEQSLLRVQDVSSKMTGFFQSTFRFGTVYVETAGEQPNFRMTNISNPQAIASLIMKIHEELIEEHELSGEITDGIGMDVIKPLKFPYKVKKSENKEVKKGFEIDNQEEIIDLESIGEDKIITIQEPKKKTNNNIKIDHQLKPEIKKIKIPNKTAELKEFKIEKSWIKQEPDKKPKTKPEKNKTIKEIFNKPIPQIPIPDSRKEAEGEIKEGEEIKF